MRNSLCVKWCICIGYCGSHHPYPRRTVANIFNTYDENRIKFLDCYLLRILLTRQVGPPTTVNAHGSQNHQPVYLFPGEYGQLVEMDWQVWWFGANTFSVSSLYAIIKILVSSAQDLWHAYTRHARQAMVVMLYSQPNERNWNAASHCIDIASNAVEHFRIGNSVGFACQDVVKSWPQALRATDMSIQTAWTHPWHSFHSG